MPQRIHVFGASGSGTTTLGTAVASVLGAGFLSADGYYWVATDPPFTTKCDPAERIAGIERDIAGQDDWVLAGSLGSWGDPLLPRFTLAVFLRLDPALRMARVIEREHARFGHRILPGGNMHAQHVAFVDWARSYEHSRVAPGDAVGPRGEAGPTTPEGQAPGGR